MLPVSIVIPAYNEAENLKRVIQESLAYSGESEIIVVDDGSTDDTKKVAESFNVQVISHPQNIGNGRAIKTGIKASKHEIVAILDGDGQHSAKYLNEMMARMDRVDMVVGARLSSGHADDFRRIANYCFSKGASLLHHYAIEDLTSGFRVFKKKHLLDCWDKLPDKFSFPTSSTLIFLRKGCSVTYLPIKTRTRRSESKIRPLVDGCGVILKIFKFRFISV